MQIWIPKDYYGKISSRSCSAFGAKVFAFDDVIDSDLNDEIKVLLRIDGDSTFTIVKNDRIAQIVIVKVHERFTMTVVCDGQPPTKKQKIWIIWTINKFIQVYLYVSIIMVISLQISAPTDDTDSHYERCVDDDTLSADVLFSWMK